jgi:hypothetical protein
MAPFVLSALLIGAALGIRFKVLVLLPAVASICTTVLAVRLARGDESFSIAITMIAAASSLQIGYLSGALGVFRQVGLTAKNPPRGQESWLKLPHQR